jgi:hypothetical protein
MTMLRELEERGKRLLPQSARDLAKHGLRGLGILTSPLRGLPDFLIIGTKRGGTTSLYNYLLAHPLVAPLFPAAQNIKGVHFFDTNFARGRAWYRSHFPIMKMAWPRRVIVGEASPYYLFHPHAPRRAHELVPDARIIVLLRDPIERAYSHYKERVRNGTEPLTFEDALTAEPERLAGEVDRMRRDPGYVSFAHEHQSYASQGIYLPQLQAWTSRFPRGRFCVTRSEDMFADPQAVYRRVLGFLGLPLWEPPRFERFNFHPSQDMPVTVRDELLGFFAPHNRRLAEFLRIDLGWDD